jgi:hypothetical protein
VTPPDLRAQGCLATLPALLVAVAGSVLLWWERSPRALLLYGAFLPLFLLGHGLAGLWRGMLPAPQGVEPLTGSLARQWTLALLASGLIFLFTCGVLARDLL